MLLEPQLDDVLAAHLDRETAGGLGVRRLERLEGTLGRARRGRRRDDSPKTKVTRSACRAVRDHDVGQAVRGQAAGLRLDGAGSGVGAALGAAVGAAWPWASRSRSARAVGVVDGAAEAVADSASERSAALGWLDAQAATRTATRSAAAPGRRGATAGSGDGDGHRGPPRAREGSVVGGDERRHRARRVVVPRVSASHAAVTRTHSGSLRERGAPGGERNGESVSTSRRSAGAERGDLGRRLLAAPEDEPGEARPPARGRASRAA